MNKKEYRKPIFKPVAIEGSSLLAGSLEDNTVGEYGGDDTGSGTAESNFSFWDDEE